MNTNIDKFKFIFVITVIIFILIIFYLDRKITGLESQLIKVFHELDYIKGVLDNM